MPIGNGPDYYDGINKDEDTKIRLYDEIENWWNSQEESLQQEIIEDYYPGTANFMDVDTMWNGITQEWKIEIWNQNR